MARKTSAPPAPEPAPELAVPQEEASVKISERIDLGKTLLQRPVASPEEYEITSKEYSKWSDYNTELLKRLFTTYALAKEYSVFYGGVFGLRRTLQEKAEDLHRDIGDKLHRLDSIKERLGLIPLARSAATATYASDLKPVGKKVFLVHGHDEGVRESTARFLEKLGLQAIILHEKASGGRTIIEKLEYHSDVDFAVILLTPDDVGAPAAATDRLSPRARQNVVLELGFFVGKLGRRRVCALHKGSVELPSDILGVVYVPLDEGAGWRLMLAKELREAGFDVDLNKAL